MSALPKIETNSRRAVDQAAMGLAVMAMLERCWLMVLGISEMSSIPRGAVLDAATEMIWRALD